MKWSAFARPIRTFVSLAGGLILVAALSGAALSAPGALVPSYPGVLNGVAALSPADAWAVGYSKTSNGAKTLVLHWNGATWARVASPNPATGYRELSAVTVLSPADAWAVGHYNPIGGGNRTLALHWNGESWAQVPSPSPDVIDGS